jgi:uncharacterized membrane protein YdfJ with MMPL/SSD domain
MPEHWTAAVLRFRWAVIACWLAVLVAGALATARLAPLLANSFAVPGTDSERARAILARSFDEEPEGTFTVVFATGSESRAALRGRLVRAARTVPDARVGEVRAGGGIVFATVATTFELQEAKHYTDALRGALGRQPGPRAYVTGQPAIQHDLDPIFAADLRRGEAIAGSMSSGLTIRGSFRLRAMAASSPGYRCIEDTAERARRLASLTSPAAWAGT